MGMGYRARPGRHNIGGVTSVVVRPEPRVPAPAIPSGDVVLPAPPPLRAAGSRWTHTLMALPMLAGTFATALLFAGKQGGTYSYVVGGVFGLSSLGMLATSFGGGPGRRARTDVAAAHHDFLRSLGTVRKQVRANVVEQRAAMMHRHPAPTELWSLVSGARIWERRGADADFGVVRVGVGAQDLATPLVPPIGAPDEPDPVAATALRDFIDRYATVPALPVALALTGFSRVRVNDAGLVRAMIAQLAWAHGPDDLVIAACVGADSQRAWSFLKWLPHAQHGDRVDASGPLRLVSTSATDLEALLAPIVSGRTPFVPLVPSPEAAHGRRPERTRAGESSVPAVRTLPQLIVIVDGGDKTGPTRLLSAGLAGCCVIEVGADAIVAPKPHEITLTVHADRRLETPVDVGLADTLSIPEAEAFARALAPHRLGIDARPAASTRAGGIGLDDLLGITDASEPITARAPRTPAERLRVPIGRRADGAPLLLDLKEAARDGMGPHGLVIGATGSGKSELLRTLVLALAATHEPDALNFVLIDFKGGATFGLLDRLPHTSAVITNLADELPLVDRMTDALNGELVRRQEILRRSGNLASVHDYDRARALDPTLPGLPALLVICDEFSELLSAKPEFIDLFVAIGRLGRSLGVHLLLASQRLEEGRLRGLDTHLSYRIGLRTFSAMESRAVLGVPDAYELPRTPGHGYLKFGTEPLVRFTAAYVSGPYEPPAVVAAPEPKAATGWSIVPFPAVSAAPPVVATRPAPESRSLPSLLDVLTAAMHGSGAPAHRVWLPPLSTSEPLDAVLGPIALDLTRGLSAVDGSLHGALRIPVGIVDRPFEQRRDPLWLTMSADAGHVAVVGGPQAGKSELVRSIVCALALTHTPREATCYCLDFGGGGLGGLRELPHVGGVAGRLAPEAVRRTIGEVRTLLTARESRFAAAGIDSIARARGSRSLDPHGDVFLVIDGWSTVRTDFDDLEPVITDIATRGLSYGVHLVITAGRWSDFRPALRDLLVSRLELRLGDPGESYVSRKAATDVPKHAAGRGLTADGRHFLAVSPVLSGGASTDDVVKAIGAAWSGPPAPAVRELPDLVPFDEIDRPASGATIAERLTIPVGVAEADLQPISVDFAADPHLLVFGDAGSGKSSVLRALAASVMRRFVPEEARLVVVDYRRSLLGELDGEHLIGYATSAGPATELITSVAGYMRGRLPGPDVTPRQLRARSWWTGPECFVLVDDLDLVTAGGPNPLAPLLEFLPQARDVGLHVVLARRSGGAGRAMFEPMLGRLRELATPGIILSGDRDEGALIGATKPQPMPPGRANLVNRRDGSRLVQIAYLPPTP